MNNPNPENSPEEQAAEEPVQQAVVAAPSPQNDSRRRLRELLSVPERDRSDEQWDEIIELEIQLAPGNRLAPNERAGNPGAGGGHGQSHAGKPGGGGAQQKKHRPRPGGGAGNNRRPRGNKPGGGGGGGQP
jgi:hypothetical protein